ncbi:hypothetical protein [Streptomyces iconiensis]|uniref:Septum formation-related domain-containing protein n=1 Tax=Streptomyces iconiensis TaxID=1384038 RepID=A0ABT6ZV33_9ACTN|nr:hypothetical protein [Streptomyces iconiensis]MDJ1132935.1 hypothetical protein [Streptomyces iconiensis]
MTMPPPPSHPPSSGPPPAQPPGGFGQPPGGFGQPPAGGGFGPPGSGGLGPPAPGGWPPPPPPGRGRGKLVAGIVAAAVVALALITAGIVFLTGGDGGTGKSADGKPGGPSSSGRPTPSQEESEGAPSAEPDDGGAATDFPTPGPSGGLPSGEPSGGTGDLALPSFMLKAGDCYDRSDKGQGSVETRDCDSAHDAEVVSRKKITGDYGSDDAVRRKADSLCRDTLKNKARQQPRGTVGGTLISYPKARGMNAGIDHVTCSLTAGQGKKLHKPLV